MGIHFTFAIPINLIILFNTTLIYVIVQDILAFTRINDLLHLLRIFLIKVTLSPRRTWIEGDIVWGGAMIMIMVDEVDESKTEYLLW